MFRAFPLSDVIVALLGVGEFSLADWAVHGSLVVFALEVLLDVWDTPQVKRYALCVMDRISLEKRTAK